MTICYHDDQDFYAGIAQLTSMGIAFKADHFVLIITITG